MRTSLDVAVLVGSFVALIAAAHGEVGPDRAPRVDERVARIPQAAPGTPWAFIGYAVTPPSGARWFVAAGTPRGGTMGRQLAPTEPHTAVLVMASEPLDRPIETDAALLEAMRERHGRIGDRWAVHRHDEVAVRHGGTRCARHSIEAREPESRSPRKGPTKVDTQRIALFATGLSCVHPTDARLLVEVALSERSSGAAMSPELQKEAEAAFASLAFHRFSEEALQQSAQAARTKGFAASEAVLKPYLDADAAWARYFMAQILERAAPAPEDLGPRLRTLLEPAATRGLADAQWALARLYLRGAAGLERDPARAEPWLRRAAERAHPAAAFQLGLSLLSGADGIAGNSREAALWIQRAAFRGQPEAQEMLREVQARGDAKSGARPAR